MKKLISLVVLVLVFSSFNFTATNVEDEDISGCFDYCDGWAVAVGAVGLSYEEEHNWFLWCYDACQIP